MADTLLSRCRVVLVRPHFAGNLGSVARVMRNFGLADLVLVAPYTFPGNPEARRLATHGEGVLDTARIVPDLGDALADCDFTLATSALTAGVVRRGMIGTPAELMPQLLAAAERGTVALVFGPEPHGLSNEEIGRCHGLIHIPVDAEFSSLNLAQAVTICCYELRKTWSAALNAERKESAPGPPVSSHADQERMFEHLREGLQAVGFLFGTRQDTLMHAVRQLIGRAMPTPGEVRMLHGLARQLLWIAGAHRQEAASKPPPDTRYRVVLRGNRAAQVPVGGITAPMAPNEIIERIESLFATRGNAQYHGEAVSQLEHALQAATLAEADGLPSEAVAAALLHDIGHLLHGLGENCATQGVDDRHEELGVRFLARVFGPRVTGPIRLHVAAKRYLCATQRGYHGLLSPASLHSLELQGGPMSAEEVGQFEANPHFSVAVKIRGYDDRAKVAGLATPDFAHFRGHLEATLGGD